MLDEIYSNTFSIIQSNGQDMCLGLQKAFRICYVKNVAHPCAKMLLKAYYIYPKGDNLDLYDWEKHLRTVNMNWPRACQIVLFACRGSQVALFM